VARRGRAGLAGHAQDPATARDLAALADWRLKIDALATTGKLTTEQRITFFTLLEQEAKSEKKPDVLKEARRDWPSCMWRATISSSFGVLADPARGSLRPRRRSSRYKANFADVP